MMRAHQRQRRQRRISYNRERFPNLSSPPPCVQQQQDIDADGTKPIQGNAFDTQEPRLSFSFGPSTSNNLNSSPLQSGSNPISRSTNSVESPTVACTPTPHSSSSSSSFSFEQPSASGTSPSLFAIAINTPLPPEPFEQSPRSNSSSSSFSFGQPCTSGTSPILLPAARNTPLFPPSEPFGQSTQSNSSFSSFSFGQPSTSGTSSTLHAAARNPPLFLNPPNEPFGHSTQSIRSSSSFSFGQPSTSGTSSSSFRRPPNEPFGQSTQSNTQPSLFSFRQSSTSGASSRGLDEVVVSNSARQAPLLFGSPNSAVHENSTHNSAAGGTRHIPFKTTFFKDGTRNIFCQSITAMPEYKDTSFEELRMQDYLAGNRGSQGEQQKASGRGPDDFNSIEKRLKDLVEDFRKVKDEHGKKEDNMRCVLCLSQPKCVALMPCRHMCLCEECSNHPSLDSCPLCRKRITDMLVVFL